MRTEMKISLTIHLSSDQTIGRIDRNNHRLVLWQLFLTVLPPYVWLIILSAVTVEGLDNVCKNDIEIRNMNEFHKLNNCAQINGSLKIVLIENSSNQQFQSLSFPDLIEITDYLVIYRVFHLRSLAKLFPNLKSIYGRFLFNDYALVICDLPDLETIGFNQIKHIKGSVRISYNTNLCFINTIDYELISKAISNSVQRHVISSNLKVHPNSDKEISIKWDSNNSIQFNSIKAYYIINIIEITDFTNYMSHQNYCNYSHPLAMKYKCNDKSQDFAFKFVENDLETKDQFLNNLMEKTYRKEGEIHSQPKPKTSTNISKFSTVYQMKKVVLSQRISALNKSTHKVIIKHLTPFTSYLIKVKACQSSSNCGIIGVKKTITSILRSADDINETAVRHSVNNNSILIEWEEPKQPNGFIISYNIEYRDIFNKSKSESQKKLCVNRFEYLQNKSYRISGLAQSKYVFKLRAVSIAGPGNWTKDFGFTLLQKGYPSINTIDMKIDKNTDKFIYFAILLTIICNAFILTAFICYLKSPSKEKSFPSGIDVISMNPEYEKFIADPVWEINKSHIRLLHVLGNGAFGRVHAGELRVNDKTIKCAVKTLNPNARPEERANFLKEANIMKSFVDSHHIVKLLGIVSVEDPVLVLMEYMANGDLKSYLRSNRPDNDENPNPCLPTLSRIIQMAIQISDGMSYLASRKFVHRDLAARNCMVSADLTVKIGDFGMTREVYDSDYYRRLHCTPIPVRWMSPESLRDGVFTTYSDIWSYGVVLWEMVTLGSQPYQGLSNEFVCKYVVGGGIMKEPENCPRRIWKVMTCCWKKNPKHRPSFPEIIKMLCR